MVAKSYHTRPLVQIVVTNHSTCRYQYFVLQKKEMIVTSVLPIVTIYPDVFDAADNLHGEQVLSQLISIFLHSLRAPWREQIYS